MSHGFLVARFGATTTLVAGCLVTGLLALASPTRLAGQISPGPLSRPHAALEGAANCVKCHGLKGAGSPMSQVCLQCHKEIGWLMQQQRGLHAREVRVARKECASCHPDHAGADFKMVEWAEGAPSKFDHRRAGWALEGNHADARCESCHSAKHRTGEAARLSERKLGAGWVGLERDCVSCHRSDDVHDGALTGMCASCHDARTWKTAPTFDHDKAAFRLDGKHTAVACERCHLTQSLKTRTNSAGERLPLFKPVPYKECSACHADPHKGRLSTKCSACHVTRGFAFVDKREFNHGLTRYPLKGAHAAVTCVACHGKDMSRKSPIFATCGSCHADAHGGEATFRGEAADCASCHRVEGFAPSTFSVAQHQETAYPLEGKHAMVTCTRCHTSAPAAGAVVSPTRAAAASAAASAASESVSLAMVRSSTIVRLRINAARCANCHDDAHGGQLAARVPATTCESCHAVRGFAPSTFGVAEHARLRLPLDGKHATIACAACHGAIRPGLPAWNGTVTLGSANVRLTALDPSCTSCHVDPHAGRYRTPGGRAGAGDCRSCHDTERFRPSTVGVTAHARFAMPLEGAHRAVPCVACHAEMRQQTAPASSAAASSDRRVGAPAASGATLVEGGHLVPRLSFAEGTTRGCATCHETPHGDQFAQRPDAHNCASCHSVEAFAPASGFDHESARFSLKGAHASVACAGCHKREAVGGGAGAATRVIYRPLSIACESCHTARTRRGGG